MQLTAIMIQRLYGIMVTVRQVVTLMLMVMTVLVFVVEQHRKTV